MGIHFSFEQMVHFVKSKRAACETTELLTIIIPAVKTFTTLFSSRPRKM